MRKSRFTEAQIIGMIKEQEAGMPTAEVCRKHGKEVMEELVPRADPGSREARLEKRVGRKGVVGPAANKKLVAAVDLAAQELASKKGAEKTAP